MCHYAVDGDTVARGHEQDHSRLDFGNGDVGPLSVGVHDGCPVRRESGKAGYGRARLFAHHMVERATDQQEKHQRRRRVEIGVLAVMDGIVEAEREGQ